MRSRTTLIGFAALMTLGGCTAQSTSRPPVTQPAAKAWPVTQSRTDSERAMSAVEAYRRDVNNANAPRITPATTPADMDPDSVAAEARTLAAERTRREPPAPKATPGVVDVPPVRSTARDEIERAQMQAQIDEQRDENKRLNDRIESLIFKLEQIQIPATAPAARLAEAPATMPADRAMRDVLSNLSNIAARTPRDPLRGLDLQIAKFLGEQNVPDAADLAALAQDDQEVISALLDALVNYRQLMRSEPNALPRQKVRAIFDLATRLRSRADLTLPTVALVKQVEGFGLYTTIDPKFKAGEDTPTAMYCEVENFRSERNEKLKWETRLTCSMELFDERGLSRWTSPRWELVEANSRERRDFFVARQFTIPAKLTAGRYSLKVTVKDLVTNRVAEKSIDLVVVNQ